jgi:hypothetical protein
MKNYWKTAGYTAIAAGLLAYPAYRLYKYLKANGKQLKEDAENTLDTSKEKAAHLFRGKRHLRNALHNGHAAAN